MHSFALFNTRRVYPFTYYGVLITEYRTILTKSGFASSAPPGRLFQQINAWHGSADTTPVRVQYSTMYFPLRAISSLVEDGVDSRGRGAEAYKLTSGYPTVSCPPPLVPHSAAMYLQFHGNRANHRETWPMHTYARALS